MYLRTYTTKAAFKRQNSEMRFGSGKAESQAQRGKAVIDSRLLSYYSAAAAAAAAACLYLSPLSLA